MNVAFASLVAAAALGACSSTNPNEAPADLVGPFDITKTSFDLATVFPEGTVRVEGDSVTVEEHRRRVAQVDLRDQKIASIRIFFEVSKARFADAHPGLRCSAKTCVSDRYPDREFELGADGATVVGIRWVPPRGATYVLANLPPPAAAAESPAKRTLGPFDLAATSFDIEKLYPGRKVSHDNDDTVTVQGATRTDVLASLTLAPWTLLVTELVLHQRQTFADFAKTHADAICSDDVHVGTTCWRPAEPDLVYMIEDPVLDGPFIEVPIAKVRGSAVAFVTWTPAKSPTVILGEGTRGPADHIPRDVVDRCSRVLASTSACSYFRFFGARGRRDRGGVQEGLQATRRGARQAHARQREGPGVTHQARARAWMNA